MKMGVLYVKALRWFIKRSERPEKWKLDFLNQYHTINNITYTPNGTEEQQLSIYYPNKDNDRNHLILDIHGGVWVCGNLNTNIAYLSYLVKQGYTVVNINYRLMDKDLPLTVKDQMCDVCMAIEWVQKNLNKYKLPKHITIMGDSSGGQLALLYALINKSNGELNYLVDNISTSIPLESGVFSSPVFDYKGIKDHYCDGSLLKEKAIPYVFPSGVTDENAIAYSPSNYLKRGFNLPIIFTACRNDFILDQSEKLEETCNRESLTYEYVYSDSKLNSIGHCYNQMVSRKDKGREKDKIVREANERIFSFISAHEKA